MNLICMACPPCLEAMGREDGDPCPRHRDYELHASTAQLAYCDHHTTNAKPHPAANRAQRRAHAKATRRHP